ncbi:MAG: adenylate/guanylate cyclase domain-containing protein [Planctomycetota bacterium]|nr:MAG: adenylate/guanylate cyclase domain-containing protein [Planctomycetota bacterium]
MSGSASLLEALCRYVPDCVLRELAREPSAPPRPSAQRLAAATLFADISGFTPLSRLLARRGPEGVERLSGLLDTYFGRLIDLVTEHGGDVARLAGDALIAVWIAEPGAQALRAAALRAAACGHAAQRTLHDLPTEEGVRLSLRLGLGAGEVLLAHVGAGERWEFVLGGPAVAQMGQAQQQARPGELVLSPQARTLLAQDCEGSPTAAGGLRLARLRVPPRPGPGERPAVPAACAARLRHYAPEVVRSRLDAGLGDWLAELRPVSVAFVRPGGLDYDSPEVLERLQCAMEITLQALARYEGMLRQLVVDDKGTVLVAAFGLPPYTHEDDAVRAVRTALDIAEGLGRAGLRSDCGVATGRVFCGPVGNPRRREYALVGDAVNLAARLMAAAQGEVLCDEASRNAAAPRLRFEPRPSLVLKGIETAVTVYRPRAQAPAGGEAATGEHAVLVGRGAERTALEQRLQALRARQQGGALLIEGEAGIGKSRLLACALDRARQLGVDSLASAADAVERTSPYHAWRAGFAQLLGLQHAPDLAARRQRLLAQLVDRPELLRLAPLLGPVLGLELPDNEVTSQMRGEARAETTRDLLLELLRSRAAAGPLLLALEDGHWFDSASWTLLLRVVEELPQALVLLSLRPFDERPPAEYTRLLALPGTQRLPLGPLPAQQVVELVAARLGVPRLAETASALIQERAQGNPFFSVELAYALRDAGVLRIADGVCQIAPEADLSRLELPRTVEGVVTSRIDRLAPAQQLALKTASVIGRVFELSVLEAVYPLPTEPARLRGDLAALEQYELVLPERPGPEASWAFRHVITRDVAYGLLLFAQRRELHRAVATHYERAHASELSPYYALLAHHWAQAEEHAKAVLYLDRAGEQALAGGAYAEAISFFSQALGRQAHLPDEQALAQARRRRQLGEAHLGMGDHAAGRRHLDRALALLGWPRPQAALALATGLVRQLAIQLGHRLRPFAWRRAAPAARTERLEGARAYQRLVETFWFTNEPLRLVHAGLRALNLAERAGPSPELARAYATMAIAAGSVPLHRVAEYYGRRAVEVAERTARPGALAYALFIASVYRIGVGAWERIARDLERAAELFEQIGDRRLLGDTRTVQAMSALYRGQFAESARRFAAVAAAGRQRGNLQHQVWGAIGHGECALRQGELARAAELLQGAVALLREHPDRAEQARGAGTAGPAPPAAGRPPGGGPGERPRARAARRPVRAHRPLPAGGLCRHRGGGARAPGTARRRRRPPRARGAGAPRVPGAARLCARVPDRPAARGAVGGVSRLVARSAAAGAGLLAARAGEQRGAGHALRDRARPPRDRTAARYRHVGARAAPAAGVRAAGRTAGSRGPRARAPRPGRGPRPCPTGTPALRRGTPRAPSPRCGLSGRSARGLCGPHGSSAPGARHARYGSSCCRARRMASARAWTASACACAASARACGGSSYCASSALRPSFSRRRLDTVVTTRRCGSARSSGLSIDRM